MSYDEIVRHGLIACATTALLLTIVYFAARERRREVVITAVICGVLALSLGSIAIWLDSQ